ncbi:uncharacterized protein LOC119113551 [Pollicipes pollicipes]|uniref:uncharacterized protein LOC119113551 n=1 Tax=Pollicipes pollicipes TaxID=41117 RepID=UPI001884C210|nr:uncharacterized protein LOC119113551 [Pollicipes pollicipes]
MMQNYVWSRRREMAGWLELPAHKSTLLQTVTAAGPALLVLGRRWPLAPAADLAATAPVRRMWLEYNNCNRSEAVVNLGDRIASTLAVLRPVERAGVASCRRAAAADLGDAPWPAQQPDTGQPHGDILGHPDVRLREMVQQQARARCGALLLAEDAGPAAADEEEAQPEEPVQPPSVANFTGLRCATNRTLSVYLLDGRRHAALVRRLGLAPDRPGALILDVQTCAPSL